MARILVTGAAGFVGRAMCRGLALRGHAVVAGVRPGAAPIEGAEPRVLGELAPDTDWSAALAGINLVIHLAQRAHRRAPEAALAGEPATAAALAGAAARAGAGRLVYMSSIKAMGETTPPGRPFRAGDDPEPQDAYGRRKLATERALAAAAAETGIEIAILRAPLVYGPGVGANFRALMRLVECGAPLPFAAVDNRRSLIFIDNLVDAAAAAAVHPRAAGQVLLVSDGVDLSTAALIRELAARLGTPARLFSVPGTAFALLRRVPGIGPALARLTLWAQLEIAETRDRLGWAPPVSVEAGLAATAASFRAAR